MSRWSRWTYHLPLPTRVLAHVKRSLISRGSELFRRYVMEERVPPHMMGYSDAGDVVEVGAEAEGFEVGQRVAISAPHAQYVTGSTSGENGAAFGIPAEMSYEDAAYLPLVFRRGGMDGDPTRRAGGHRRIQWARAGRQPLLPGRAVT